MMNKRNKRIRDYAWHKIETLAQNGIKFITYPVIYQTYIKKYVVKKEKTWYAVGPVPPIWACFLSVEGSNIVVDVNGDMEQQAVRVLLIEDMFHCTKEESDGLHWGMTSDTVGGDQALYVIGLGIRDLIISARYNYNEMVK